MGAGEEKAANCFLTFKTYASVKGGRGVKGGSVAPFHLLFGERKSLAIGTRALHCGYFSSIVEVESKWG